MRALLVVAATCAAYIPPARQLRATKLHAVDADVLRQEFPALRQKSRGHDLVYFDSGATSQKPQSVLDATTKYYEEDNANVHRGAHLLSARATASYEGARDKVASFINANAREEVVFTRGATEAINLVAQVPRCPHVIGCPKCHACPMRHGHACPKSRGHPRDSPCTELGLDARGR